MTKCEKHQCGYKVRQMEHGKTMYVCPECEKEQMEKFKKMFGISGTTEAPVFPTFYGGRDGDSA